ncbi:hypothetical protein KI387_029767, partial [Taxus chinensis]
IVDVVGAMDMEDVTVIAGIVPNCDTNEGKVDIGSTEPDGATTGVGMRVGGIDMDML